jgi:ABC-type lipoprotein export system ATPase subunit
MELPPISRHAGRCAGSRQEISESATACITSPTSQATAKRVARARNNLILLADEPTGTLDKSVTGNDHGC